MKNRQRGAFTLFQLLIILAVLAILLAVLVPAVLKVREAAARTQSVNNLKQIALAALSYENAKGHFPSGNDKGNYSASTHLLPYIDQGNLYKAIDLTKPMDDKANAKLRMVPLRVFTSPRDSVFWVSTDFAATNYLFNAGSKPSLEDNDGVFYQDSKVKAADITDGLSQTLLAVETLKGNSGVNAVDMRRQLVLLKKDDLKGIKDDAGVKDWENNKNIVADRCASWMDGRFLQGTFTATRNFNDEKPDVNCAGYGGLSGVRTVGKIALVGLCDGSVRAISKDIKLEGWKALAGRNDGIPLPNDF
jgi:type II secretory pathway pseudopilin PulG